MSSGATPPRVGVAAVEKPRLTQTEVRAVHLDVDVPLDTPRRHPAPPRVGVACVEQLRLPPDSVLDLTCLVHVDTDIRSVRCGSGASHDETDRCGRSEREGGEHRRRLLAHPANDFQMTGGRPAVYKKHNPLFKNMISCGTCGGVVTWQLQKGRYYGACQRRNPICKVKKTIREDRLEETIHTLLNDLVCPSSELIDWVVAQLETKRKTTSRTDQDSLEGVNKQIERLARMDGDLYDDKLAGDITKDVYQTKHASFMEQLNELRQKQAMLEDKVNGNDLPQRLALLKLTQKAAKLYQTRTIDQKRVILTKLFTSFTYSDGAVSVKYSKFASVIANKTLKTKEILGR